MLEGQNAIILSTFEYSDMVAKINRLEALLESREVTIDRGSHANADLLCQVEVLEKKLQKHEYPNEP